MRKRVLITGGAGYIGSVTAKSFLDAGHDVVVFDNLSTGQREAVDSRAEFIEGDVCNEVSITRALKAHQSDLVVHLAARKSIYEGEKEPEKYRQTNIEGVRSVLTAMKAAGVPHIIFSSSAAVYGRGGEYPYDEQTPVRPGGVALNVYGETKVAAEELINSFVEAGDLKMATIFRYFNVAGVAGNFREKEPSGLLSHITQAIKDKQPIHIFGSDYSTQDGTAIRDYVHVADIARAHVIVCEKEVRGVFNLGSGSGYSVQEIVDAFSKQLGKPLEVVYEKRRPGDVSYSCAAIQKAAQELGWRPQHSLEDIVVSYLTLGL